jgi:ferredoxin
MTKISINQNDCIGCSYCESCVPDVFKVDENIKAKVKENDILKESAELELTAEEMKKVKESAEGCAVQAIKIE